MPNDRKISTKYAQTALFLIVIGVLFLSGCAPLQYYWNNANGHIAVMRAAKPVDDWLLDEKTPQSLKNRLELAQKIRTFASKELALPDNASYTRYADLKRPAVVWNVVAAPVDSLVLKTWCFVVAGCVGYRGYYSQEAALSEAQIHKAAGLEVSVYGVPAYSTLGYLNWLGGDPLLSTFIQYPEGELARLIFHELAHQVLYVNDDTAFNESFASAVERLGGNLWLAQSTPEAQSEYEAYNAQRQQFKALMLKTRSQLAEIYKEKLPENPAKYAQTAIKNEAFKLQQKAQIMQNMRTEYEQLKASWSPPASRYVGYDKAVREANNASLGAQGAYEDLVPQFEAAFERQGRSFAKFYDAVQRIEKLPKDERRIALKELGE